MSRSLFVRLLLALPVTFTVACTALPRMPVDGYVTQTAGSHPGTDIAAPLGTTIAAMCRGTVTEARSTPASDGRGNIVVITHDNGYQTQYWHLSGFAVSPGQVVGSGQIVGYVGSTGYSTGPHLHFQLNHNGQLQIDALNATFQLHQNYKQGTLWGAGLDPALACP